MNLASLIKDYRWQSVLMVTLILLDAGLLILFPLVIGFAVDDALIQNYGGSILLGGLGLFTLIIGAGRRFYDSRLYAKIYERLGVEVGSKANESTSTQSAHIGFLKEVVEFFEHSIPEIVNNAIALVGTLAILFTMDTKVFIGCLVILLIVAVVYAVGEKRTVRFNASYNREYENQVTVLSKNSPILLRWHLKTLMKWNIKLSDLETINFSIIWLFMMAFLVISIVTSIGSGMFTYGAIFALVLYLFQFIENISTMPLYYQEWLRLKEIMQRLKAT